MSDKLRAALHGARYLPAAAVPVGAVVRVRIDPAFTLAGAPTEAVDEVVEIVRVHNAYPVPGRIRWETMGSADIAIGGATRVEIVSLP